MLLRYGGDNIPALRSHLKQSAKLKFTNILSSPTPICKDGKMGIKQQGLQILEPPTIFCRKWRI